jgi:hypothetical protein
MGSPFHWVIKESLGIQSLQQKGNASSKGRDYP